MKPGVKFGLICGGVSIVWSLLMYVTGFNRLDSAWIFNTLSIGITVLFCSMAINEVRTTTGGGYIRFNTAFRESFIVITINSIIASVFSSIYMKYIDPTFVDFIMQKKVAEMQERGMGEEQMQKVLDMTAKWMTPGMMFMWALVGTFVVGILVALVMAAILKKPNPEEIV